MNMNKIDINKTYRTKAGHDVQIFTTGAPEPYPVVGIWKDCLGTWWPSKWRADGQRMAGEESFLDLEEVKPKRLVYVNLYSATGITPPWWISYDTEEEAKESAAHYAIAVAIPVYIESEIEEE